ncbi:MAG: hypothetical protein PSV35_02365 [bacterium]|nr:hypothetical protein [bacterium]
MTKCLLTNKLIIGTLILLITAIAQASAPLWTFSPMSATKISVPANGTKFIQYKITNQSHKTHTLVMTAIPGISQVTTSGNCPNPITLGYQQYCTLNLSINGRALTSKVLGGPQLCQKGNKLQCYQPSQENSLNITKSGPLQKPQYAYVSTGQKNVWQCGLNTNGTLNTCSTILTESSPIATTFASVNNVEYAYLVNDTNGSDFSVYMNYCTVTSNGGFNDCKPIYINFAEASQLAIASVSGVQHAYVADQGPTLSSGSVYLCSLNTDGSVNAPCLPTPASGAPPAWIPEAITFASVNGVQYAYVGTSYNTANSHPGSVYQCTLNKDGSFKRCTTTPAVGAPFASPNAITFTSVNGVQYAYVSDGGNGGTENIYQCMLNTDGSFKTCKTITALFVEPNSIAFAVINDAQYAYVADANPLYVPAVWMCSLNTNGSFNICTTTPENPPWAIVGSVTIH